MNSVGCQSMVARLRRVIVKRPDEAFGSPDQIGKQWKQLGYTRPPDVARASADHQRFVDLMKQAGAEVLYEPAVRPEYHASYFGAFVRDPDGNNVEAVCHSPE